MPGVAGNNKGTINATKSAKVFNQIRPYFLSIDSLTLFPNTELYDMYKKGDFQPAGEKERMIELQTLIKNLQIRIHLLANTVSNYMPITAYLPKYKDKTIAELQYIIDTVNEDDMISYRQSLKSLGQ
ncbi:MAG: hypothetical protein ACK5LC_04275 [Coprobacillaceae bacterium]